MILKMKAIILAAGEGKRLRPLTNNNPKCMVNLFGKKIIDYQIQVFKKLGINDITIITGYKADSVDISNVKTYQNKEYDKTNMVTTLFCAENELVGETIVSYGDIIFEREILEKLLKSKEDFSIIIDKNWRDYWEARFNDPINDAESLKLDSEENILDIGKKVSTLNEIEGQYIGLMKFSKLGVEKIKKLYNEMKDGKNPLERGISFKKLYMTDFLQCLINEGNKLKAIPIKSRWLEVDTIEDYQLYEKLYQNNEIKKFFDPKDFI
tara:strand:+ start:672 stop:1469 length:798 start_codon:yes stop_codon:yes gene_type:complete